MGPALTKLSKCGTYSIPGTPDTMDYEWLLGLLGLRASLWKISKSSISISNEPSGSLYKSAESNVLSPDGGVSHTFMCACGMNSSMSLTLRGLPFYPTLKVTREVTCRKARLNKARELETGKAKRWGPLVPWEHPRAEGFMSRPQSQV